MDVPICVPCKEMLLGKTRDGKTNLSKVCRSETRMQKNHAKCNDVGSVKFSYDPQVVKEIIGKVVSGVLSQSANYVCLC